MKVYDALREELMADELIAGQPSFSAEYMRKVNWPQLRVKSDRLILLDMCLSSITPCLHAQMLDYNVPGGKLNRGLAVGDILCHLKQDVRQPQASCTACLHHVFSVHQDGLCCASVQVTERELFGANVLGWCVEWVRPVAPCCLPSAPCPRPHSVLF